MKKIISLALILLSSVAMAKNVATAQNSKNLGPSKKDLQLGTSFRFSAMALKGKYQQSPSTEAIVENDKYLEDLLGPRRSFADRIKQNQQRN